MNDVANLVKLANARFKHSESKLLLQEKYKSKLVIPYGGGMWELTPQLIAFLRTSSESVVILCDIYNNPVSVDTVALLELAQKTFQTVMSEWHKEYTKLNKNR